MTPGLVAFASIMLMVAVYSLIAYRLFPKKVQTGEGQPTTSESSGGIMNWIARKVVLGLGRITFGALHLFEKLGVDMATIDETLAAWTARDKDLVTKLKDAQDAIQQLKDTDAAEDKAQADRLTAEIEAKVQAAYDAVVATPETGDVEGDDPETTPVDDTPVVPDPDEPTVPPAPFDPAPVDPDAPVTDDGTGPVADETVADGDVTTEPRQA